MNALKLASGTLIGLGTIAMIVGALDPLEGSLMILLGSGAVTLGVFLSKAGRGLLIYWISTFALISVGVSAMFVLSALGGIGGNQGLSLWWGLLIAPYPIGWTMGILSQIFWLVRAVRRRHAAT